MEKENRNGELRPYSFASLGFPSFAKKLHQRLSPIQYSYRKQSGGSTGYVRKEIDAFCTLRKSECTVCRSPPAG